MQISQDVINDLISRIKHVVEPEEIILFGSVARGLMAHDSDIDVLVVVPDGTHRRHTCQRIYRSLRGFGQPVDVLVATKNDLIVHKEDTGFIYRNILSEGKTIYAA